MPPRSSTTPAFPGPSYAGSQQSWVEAVRHGDEAAYEALFRTFYPELHRLALHYTGCAEAAEDLVQDVFLGVWDRRRTWAVTTTLRAYLCGAVRKRAINRWERERVRRAWADEAATAPPDPLADPSERLHGDALYKAVQAWIGALPERRREVFLLSRQHGLTYKEIAAVLGLSEKTVETQMGRALKFLRARLSDFLPLPR